MRCAAVFIVVNGAVNGSWFRGNCRGVRGVVQHWRVVFVVLKKISPFTGLAVFRFIVLFFFFWFVPLLFA